MNLLPLIEAKREGETISPEQIEQMANAVAREECQPEQLGALLMAIYCRGLNTEETRQLTLTMRDSGTVLEFPDDPRPLVDKHSTGGVGDKVSLILAPLLAVLGFRVPMISGRGLGITGGTLDKMESIPGCRTNLSPEEIVEQVQTVGCVICGQTEEMIPADRILYSTRDITGTIPSIPLITSSILSKKLAENISSLLLDVKTGNAAFMRTIQDARALAGAMTTLGRECGLNIRALLTDMNTPLGSAAGNWLEVREVVDCLSGRAPADLEQLVIESAAHLLEMSGKAVTLESAREAATECLTTNKPQLKFEEMLAAQGADLDQYRQMLAKESGAPTVSVLKSKTDGYVTKCDAHIIGEIVHELGGGRTARTDSIQPDVGVDTIAKPGSTVGEGSVLARVHASDESAAQKAASRLATAITVGSSAPTTNPVILETLR